MDLGRQITDYDCCEAPSEPAKDKKVKMKKVYPHCYIEGVPEAVSLPDEGTATIKFKVTSREISKRTRDGKDKVRGEVTLEILDLKPNKAAKKEKTTEQVLDDLLKEVTA